MSDMELTYMAMAFAYKLGNIGLAVAVIAIFAALVTCTAQGDPITEFAPRTFRITMKVFLVAFCVGLVLFAAAPSEDIVRVFKLKAFGHLG